MSEHEGGRDAVRTPDERRTDHEAIERLSGDVLPALVARLGASGLGELEVREDGWRIRIRRAPGERRGPGTGRAGSGRIRDEARHAEGRGGDAVRPSDGSRGPAGDAAGRLDAASARGGAGPADADATAADGGPAAGSSELPPLTSVLMEAADADVNGPLVATSPAVGIFRLRGELRTGARVRAGDRLANVDMLGVPQEVTAPADGVVATALVEDGDAVEYGQPLVVLEPIATPGRGA